MEATGGNAIFGEFFRVIDQFWSKSKESGDEALFLLLNDRDHITVMSHYNELGLPSVLKRI